MQGTFPLQGGDYHYCSLKLPVLSKKRKEDPL
jgi:hypothetical protein